MKRGLAFAAAMLTLTACSGSEPEYADKDALAEAAGCSSIEWEAEYNYGSEFGGECVTSDFDVTLFWFKDSEQLESWMESGDVMGDAFGTSSLTLVGDTWAATSNDGSRTDLEAAQSVLGGGIEG